MLQSARDGVETFKRLPRFAGRQKGQPTDPCVGKILAAKQMKLFSAAGVLLALLTLSHSGSLAQSAPPPLGVIGQTSPLGSTFGTSGNLDSALQSSSLPYSGTAAPCSMPSPSTLALRTFDGGGLPLSMGTTISGLLPGAYSATGGTQLPCPTVSTSGIATTATTNSVSTSTLSTATAHNSAAANSSSPAAPNSSPGAVVQGMASLGTSSLGT